MLSVYYQKPSLPTVAGASDTPRIACEFIAEVDDQTACSAPSSRLLELVRPPPVVGHVVLGEGLHGGLTDQDQ